MIFLACLDAMMTVAKALPIALIPEQCVVTSVRSDVIDIGRLDVVTFLHALYTQWVCLKVTLACFVPCTAIAAATC